MADIIEFEGIEPVSSDILMDNPVYENAKLVISHMYNEETILEAVPFVNRPITITHLMSEGVMERVNKVHTNYNLLTLFSRGFDEEDDEVYYGREVREWDAILMSSNGSESPRRNPSELIYKGKKMKNDFYVPPQLENKEE